MEVVQFLPPTPGDNLASPDGVFFTEMTEEEYTAFIKNEDLGWKDFMKKVFNPDAQNTTDKE